MRLLLFLGLGVGLAASAQERPVPDTYTAVTANMTPEGVELKADVLEWSDESARMAVIDALQSEDPAAALAELPTAGVVWRSGSAVGSSIKYAHRAEGPDGAEQIVLVTDRRIGATSFNSWSVAGQESGDPLPYSVVQLDLGSGEGRLSLGAEVRIDDAGGAITLAADGPPLLIDATLEPPPYWAREN